jgi:transaldolase
MSLLLDSALAQDARQAMALGFITGITTNPSLMAQVNRPAEEVIAEIADICPGTVFYQLIASTVAEREAEARRFLAMRKNIGLKIACTTENLALAHKFASEGVTVGVTAIYSAAQCYLACQAGVRYAIPYVNRSTRLQGDGLALVEKMRAITDAHDGPTKVLVASLKSPAEVVEAVLAGAQHVTIPLALILEMGNHPLSDQAIEEFRMANVKSQISKGA